MTNGDSISNASKIFLVLILIRAILLNLKKRFTFRN
uniref:Uncharacterized protein n=1 Tax=Myoviridae sp. ctT3B27 TaxID=2826655 RepID=A0A8S5NBH1_9CAUD|nr:MAG TPA: hypothetical protein [Myoviridae sp. ctT3B27]